MRHETMSDSVALSAMPAQHLHGADIVAESLGPIALMRRQMGLARAGVDVGGTDFAAVARAMGGHGVTITDRETLGREAETAFRRDGFSLLACRIDAASYEGAF